MEMAFFSAGVKLYQSLAMGGSANNRTEYSRFKIQNSKSLHPNFSRVIFRNF